MLDVCLLGTGGMMPLPGRHLTALLLRYNGHSILLDCGEGTQVAIRKYGWSMHSIDVICFTHVHGDHVAGISGLLSSMGTEGRSEPVHIIGPGFIESVVSQLCVVMAVPFDVIFHSVKEENLENYGVQIHPFPVKHNISCYGYRFEIPRRPKFFPEKAKALGVPLQDWKKLQAGEPVRLGLRKIRPEDVCGPPRRGISLVYSTDTRPCRKLEEAARDVDLLITEGIYGDPQKHQSAVEKHHMTSQEAAALAKKAGARRVWLTHYSPSFRNQRDYDKAIKSIYDKVSFASDGQTLSLNFPEEEEPS